jgi:hypothetical protein
MTSLRWTAIELLNGSEREQYNTLKNLVTQFELTLEYKQWRKSDWYSGNNLGWRKDLVMHY